MSYTVIGKEIHTKFILNMMPDRNLNINQQAQPEKNEAKKY